MKRLTSFNGYFHCQGDDCDYKAKKIRCFVYFKGRYLCHFCKVKVSKCSMYLPKDNPSENTLIKHTRLPEGRNMPRESWKGMIKVTPELKEWAEKKSKPKVKAVWVGLSSQEHKLLWNHFYAQGLSDEQIEVKINEVKEQIKKSHELAKDRLRENVPTFKEEFEKLVGLRA